MNQRMRVQGRGRMIVTAHGVADAEHRAEVAAGRLWPEARLSVMGVDRLEGDDRLVCEYGVRYGLVGDLMCAGETPEALVREAFRQARRKLEGSELRSVEWVRATPLGGME
jgi:hypothetical protein